MRGGRVLGVLLGATVLAGLTLVAFRALDRPAPDPAPRLHSEVIDASDARFAIAERFVRATASNDPEAVRDAAKLVVERSPAHAYLIHYTAVQAAARDAGAEPIRFGVATKGETIDVCDEGARDRGEEAVCVKLADFSFHGTRLETFTIHGAPLADRIRAPRPDRIGDPQTGFVTAVSSYAGAHGTSTFTVKIEAGARRVLIARGGFAYRDPQGGNWSVVGLIAATELEPGESAHIVVAVGPADLGGTLRIRTIEADSDTVRGIDLAVG